MSEKDSVSYCRIFVATVLSVFYFWASYNYAAKIHDYTPFVIFVCTLILACLNLWTLTLISLAAFALFTLIFPLTNGYCVRFPFVNVYAESLFVCFLISFLFTHRGLLCRREILKLALAFGPILFIHSGQIVWKVVSQNPGLALFCSSSVSDFPHGSAFYLRASFLFLLGPIVYLLFYHLITNKDKLLAIVDELTIIFLLISLAGAVQFHLNDTSHRFLLGNRAQGPFALPSYLATFLLMPMPLLFYRLPFSKISAASFVCVFAVMILTKSVGGLLSVAAVFFMIYGTSKRRLIGKPAFLCFLALSAVVLIKVSLAFLQAQTPANLHQMTNGRWFLWKGGLNMLRSRPINGVGLGNYSRLLSDYHIDDFRLPAGANNAHCMHAQIIAETGMVGAFLYYYFIVALLVRANRNAGHIHGPDVQAALKGLHWGIIAFLINMAFDSSQLVPSINILFFIFLGALASSANLISPKHRAQ